jgi:hypothetical protein
MNKPRLTNAAFLMAEFWIPKPTKVCLFIFQMAFHLSGVSGEEALAGA